MKKLFVVLSLVLATSFAAFAQRPVAGAKAFTFGLENPFGGSANVDPIGSASPTGSLLFKYYVSDHIAARFSINYTKSSDKLLDTAGTVFSGQEFEAKTSTSRFAIAVGAQKAFGEGEKLEPYIGADIFFAKTSGKYFERTEVVNVNGGTVGDFQEVNTNAYFNPFTSTYVAPTTTFGLAPVVGFNYFFTENFAFGAEFGWGIGMVSSKKVVEEVITGKTGGVADPTVTNFINTGNLTSNSSLSTTGTGEITITVAF
jgi:hypothetical protein